MKKFLLFLALLPGQAFGATGTTYNPATFAFDADRLIGDGQGVSAVCAALGTTNLDITLTDDSIMTGAVLIVSGASAGDYADLKVLNGGTTLATPITSWFLPATGTIDYQMVVPKKIIGGLTLRLVVHTTALLVTPTIAINYKLWKIIP